MLGGKVLRVSENADLTNACECRPFYPASKGGMLPPGTPDRLRQPAVGVVLLGTVELSPVKADCGAASESSAELVRRKLPEVRAYIQTHYREKITLNTLAAFAGAKPAELARIFLREVGVSVTGYLEDTRLERAAALLRGTERAVAAIAASVGFSGVSYFIRRFREAYGMTPGHYRMKSLRAEKANECTEAPRKNRRT